MVVEGHVQAMVVLERRNGSLGISALAAGAQKGPIALLERASGLDFTFLPVAAFLPVATHRSCKTCTA
jgi:hypothetical protein